MSIVSFEETVKDLVPHLQKRMELKGKDSCPLIVDVASVKEHPRNILLEHLPEECDVLATHPMFGPDSARDGWQGQRFVYEKTRINKVLWGSSVGKGKDKTDDTEDERGGLFFEDGDLSDDDREITVEGVDRMERFLR